MKIGRYLFLGAAGFAAYQAYKHREEIKAGFYDIKESSSAINQDIDKIKDSLATITEQRAVLAKISQELTYKIRVFQNETQARLDEIQKRLKKYQTEEE
ncbi:hypothetical protein [Streptococcus dentiloxodontae]